MTDSPKNRSFTGRSVRPAAWSILLIGVLMAANSAATPRTVKLRAVMGAEERAPKISCVTGCAITLRSSDAGMENIAVAERTDRTLFCRASFFPLTQAVVTLGSALVPKA